jgi:hypothetical protein
MKSLTLGFLLTFISLASYADNTKIWVNDYSEIKFVTPKLKLKGTLGNPCDVFACGYDITIYNDFEKTAESHCKERSFDGVEFDFKITKSDIQAIVVSGPDKIVAYDVDLEAECVRK